MLWGCAAAFLRTASLALPIAGMRIPMSRQMIARITRISGGSTKPLLSFDIIVLLSLAILGL